MLVKIILQKDKTCIKLVFLCQIYRLGCTNSSLEKMVNEHIILRGNLKACI